VRIWGNDQEGNPFTEHVCTIDISHKGASIAAVKTTLVPGDTVGLQYRNRQARYRVAWIAPSRTGQGHNVGLECIQVGKELWPVDTPAEGEDSYTAAEAKLRLERTQEDRRVQTRYPVSGAARVRGLDGEGGRWTKLGDISLTGCYLHTTDPLNVGRSVSLLIKVGNQEFEAVAIVRSSIPGIAMGLEFTFLHNSERVTLRAIIARLKELDLVAD
jgi:PilZ domain